MDYQKKFCFYILPSVLNLTTVCACTLQYISLILFIHQEFVILNEMLLKIKRENFGKMTNVRFITSIPNLKVKKVYELQKLHSQLYELVEKVSDFYSLPIFLCISKLFFSLLHTSFMIIQMMITPQVNVSLEKYVHTYIREFMVIFILLHLSSAASLVMDQVSKNYLILF